MAEDAQKSEVKDLAAKKGRARKKKDEKPEEVVAEETQAEAKTGFTEELQDEIREQVINCKNELQITLKSEIEREFRTGAIAEIRRANRRRRISNLMHDIVIVILVGLVVYFGYCLYDVRYFDFMKSPCERDQTCQTTNDPNNPVKEVLKDTDWYIENYGYLFDNLQIKLDADNVDAYYLYSGDYKLADIKSNYLLAMAYNKVQPNFDANNSLVTVGGEDLRTAFKEMFGSLDYYVQGKFTYNCQNFTFSQENDNYTATYDATCLQHNQREIVETIDEMYEEGNVLYVLTTATIFDKLERNFYAFDDLFRPIVINADKDNLQKYSARLNHYQYQFKKIDGRYCFSGITKLQ